MSFEAFDASSVQKRLYLINQLQGDSILYNLSYCWVIEGHLQPRRLETAMKKLVQRHETLRTSFAAKDGEVFQKVHQNLDFQLKYREIQEPSTIDIDSIINDLIQPFDLANVPLWRMELVQLQPGKQLLIFDIHHIIFDGVSVNVMINDLMTFYTRKELPPLEYQYVDFTMWQNEQLKGPKIKRQEQYWLKVFEGELPLMEMPEDYPRSLDPDINGEIIEMDMDMKLTAALNQLALKQNTTLYVVLLTLYTILLYRTSGQEDIIVGSVVTGRTHPELQPVIGMFVNTLAMRNQPSGSKTFKDFLSEVSQQVFAAFENQDYPFEMLVEKLVPQRHLNRNPLFDTMFTLQNFSQPLEFPDLEQSKLKCVPYVINEKIAIFDLTLFAYESQARLFLRLQYRSSLFRRDTMERFIHHFIKLSGDAVLNPGLKISELDIITGEEIKYLLGIFNTTGKEYPENRTIHDLFEQQVEQTPDHIALVGIHQKGTKELTSRPVTVSVTYHQLNKLSNQVAYKLCQEGVKENTLVGIKVERSLDMIIAILGILKSGAAYVPLNPRAPQARNTYILDECGISHLLTPERLSDYQDETLFSPPGTQPPAHRSRSAASLAYAIFTSGSTGKPKGVLIRHANLSPLLHWGYKHLAISSKDHTLQNLAYYFDWSVWEIFITLTSGACLFPVAEEILLNPQACTGFIDKHTITVLHITPTQYQYLINDPVLQGGRKSETLRYLFIGAEKLTYDLVQRSFARVNNRCRVFNMYGPTETTIISAVLEIQRNNYENFKHLSSVPIGTPAANTILLILDKYLKLCPIHIAGELHIGGSGLSQGYLNNPALTSEKFIKGVYLPKGHLLLKTKKQDLKAKFYKTGDLVQWLSEGNIEFLGRSDQQIKIRGFRIELGEIENQLIKHPQIKEAVVLHKQDETSDKYLCAYIVSDQEGLARELKHYLSDFLPNYMIPAIVVPIEKIPLTPNGKINRKLLPEPGTRQTREKYTLPRDEIERKLVHIWAGVLGRDTLNTSPAIGIDDNFFELGGHSLKAMVLLARIHQQMNVELSLVEFFKAPFIRELSGMIKKNVGNQFAAIEPVEKKEFYALSSAQARIYILQQIELNSTAYNIPQFAVLEGKIDNIRIKDTLNRLIQRHESLRTSFTVVNQEPVQKVHKPEEVEIETEFYNLATENTGNTEKKILRLPNHKLQITNKKERKKTAQHPDPKSQELRAKSYIYSFIRPFDLSQAPLLRVGLIKLPHTPTALRSHPSQEGKEDKYLLMLDMHHIICDGSSIEIVVKDFMSYYSSKELPGKKLQYKDYSHWQRGDRAKKLMIKQEQYWLKQFASEIPVLDLPADFARPAVQSFAGSTIKFGIDRKSTEALKTIALDQETTLYMVLLTITNIFLSKINSQEDIVIGTPVAGRRHAELEDIIGMFVNTLALRNQPSGDKTFPRFLKEVKNNTLQAFENQDYPFEELVETLAHLTRDASRNPLFDVMFAFQNWEFTNIEIPGLTLKSYPFESGISKFDLTLQGIDREERLEFTLEYCTTLFRKKTIQRFINYFKRILTAVVREPNVKIGELEIISGEEKRKVLYDFNDTGTAYPIFKTIHELFAEQVEKKPDHIALVGEEGTRGLAPLSEVLYITYNQLNKSSNQLVHLLKEKGAKPDNIVGIMVERSIEMIIGILGILKSGAAYLPINPKNPETRIRYMLEDSNVGILLTTPKLQVKVKSKGKGETGQPQGLPLQFVNLETESTFEPFYSTVTSTSACQVRPTNLAYIIYTSGSTGNPKGVPIKHSNFSQLVHWGYTLGLGPQDRVIQNLSYYFDWSVWEIFITLTTGAGLFMITGEILQNPSAQVDFIIEKGITVLHITPTQFQYLVNVGKKLETLKYLFIGAEKLTTDLVKRSIASVNKDCRVFNMYGPTEATIISATLEIQPMGVDEYQKLTSVPIGKPTGNMKLLVVNRYMNICPMGVTGVLCIAGDGLAAGYLNNPELTSEKFKEQVAGASDSCGWETTSTKKFLREILRKAQSAGHKAKNTIGAMRKAPCAIRLPPGRRRQNIYKTGDLARWLADGTVEFLGRVDFQVKVRGNRIELSEIENHLLNHDDVREVVVIDREFENNEKYLCGYVVLEENSPLDDKKIMSEELRKYLSQSLPDYMIPTYFIPLDHIPLNPNGKIHRSALPVPEINEDDRYTAPRDEVEAKLVDIWSDVLGIERDRIGINSNFFELGGHSLKAILITAEIHKELNVKIPLSEVFKIPTLKNLSAYIRGTTEDKFIALKVTEKKEYYELSSAQKRLYVIQQMDLANTSYNMPLILCLTGKLDLRMFEEAFNQLIKRHESLRTSFKIADEEPVQGIYDEVDFEIEYHGATRTAQSEERKMESDALCAMRGASIIKNFIRPFDLSRAPLLRIGLIHTPRPLRGHPTSTTTHQGEILDSSYILMVDMHHIISDEVSQDIFINDLSAFYQGYQLPQLRLQYKDFSGWQNHLIKTGAIKKQEEYWLKTFEGEIPLLKIPTDYERPDILHFQGRTLAFEIGSTIYAKIKSFVSASKTTLNILLLAAYNVLLSKYTGQKTILMGNVIAGRRHADLQNIIGFFVNMLAIKNHLDPQQTFEEFLGEVKENCINAYENQDYQFEELVSKLDIERKPGRHPLIDAVFVIRELEDKSEDIQVMEEGGLKVSPYEIEHKVAHFDLMLHAAAMSNSISMTIEYSNALFKPATIEEFSRCYIDLLEQVMKNKMIKLKEITISYDIMTESSDKLRDRELSFEF